MRFNRYLSTPGRLPRAVSPRLSILDEQPGAPLTPAPLPLGWSPPPERREELIHRLKQVTPRVMDNPHAEPDVPEWRRRSARKAAVALIFVQGESPKLILTKRSDALPFAGQWCFPGGKEEAEDDGLPSTAKRESYEEIGLDPDHMLHLGSMGQYYTHTGFCIYPELFVLDPKAAWRTSSEVSEIALVPLAELANPDRYELFWRSNDRANYRFKYGEMIISGPTISMCIHLLHRLTG